MTEKDAAHADERQNARQRAGSVPRREEGTLMAELPLDQPAPCVPMKVREPILSHRERIPFRRGAAVRLNANHLRAGAAGMAAMLAAS